MKSAPTNKEKVKEDSRYSRFSAFAEGILKTIKDKDAKIEHLNSTIGKRWGIKILNYSGIVPFNN